MRVRYIGSKRGATSTLAKTCTKDVIMQTDLVDDDIVAILTNGKHTSCYELEGLANWFLEGTMSKNTLPFLPETRASVPAHIYKQIVDAARSRIDGFEGRMLNDIQDFPTTRREFVLSGIRSAVSPRRTRRNAGVSIADARRAAARRSSRSPARERSRSPNGGLPDIPLPNMTDDELFAMLPSVQDMEADMAGDRISAEELMELIRMRRRRRSSRRRRRNRQSRRRR